MSSEAEFWEFVARERGVRPQDSLEAVVAWLELEKRKAEDAKFKAVLERNEAAANYQLGRIDTINEVLRRLRRVEA